MALSRQTPVESTPRPERTPLFLTEESEFLTEESNQYIFDDDATIELQNSHPLFDIPVMEAYDAFVEALYELHADKTFANNYDGIEVLCFKAETAIEAVLDINELEEKGVSHATRISCDINVFETFTDFTSSWFETFVNHYNELLHEETPAEFDTMRDAANSLSEDSMMSPELIVQAIATELGVDCTRGEPTP